MGAQGTYRFWRSVAEPHASVLVLSYVVFPLWKSCIEKMCIKRKGRRHTGRVNLYLLILNVLQLLTTSNLQVCVLGKEPNPQCFGVHGRHHHVLSETWKDFSLHLLCCYCCANFCWPWFTKSSYSANPSLRVQSHKLKNPTLLAIFFVTKWYNHGFLILSYPCSFLSHRAGEC